MKLILIFEDDPTILDSNLSCMRVVRDGSSGRFYFETSNFGSLLLAI